MTCRDAASVKIKLKVTATQRHHRERAARAPLFAISKVRFLYGLPTYVRELSSQMGVEDGMVGGKGQAKNNLCRSMYHPGKQKTGYF